MSKYNRIEKIFKTVQRSRQNRRYSVSLRAEGHVLVRLVGLSAGRFSFVRGDNVKLKARLMDEAAMSRALMRISHEITEKNKGVEDVVLIGIRRRGVPISERIRDNIKKIEDATVPCGSVDIRFYRDDLTHESDQPVITKADIGADVNDKNVVLVDDVLYTGRTARAAIEAVFTAGRPRSIQFAVLVDRGHRELPIRADYVGKNVPTSRAELIEVRLPEFDGETGVYLMEIE